jgi:hypothetical protein
VDARAQTGEFECDQWLVSALAEREINAALRDAFEKVMDVEFDEPSRADVPVRASQR